MQLQHTLLLVGDAETDRAFLRQIFWKEYNLLEASSIEQGLFLLEQNADSIAAVIVDRPPAEPAETFLFRAERHGVLGDTPVMVVMPEKSTVAMEEFAFSLGAADVMNRSASEAIYKQRVRLLVDLYQGRRELLTAMEHQAETIRHTNEVMVDALSSIIEYRSAESGSHILRIRLFTEILLREVSLSCPEYGLTPDIIRNIVSASALHDIGKISIPDSILDKPGRLTEEEMEIMRQHTLRGAELIKNLEGVTSAEYLRYAYNIARYHHERWDGGGYPEGLEGEEIPICAQVVAIADVFDALTTDRVYKKAISPAEAANMILDGKCGVFSSKLLTCFKGVLQPMMELAAEYKNGRRPEEDRISLPLPPPQMPDQEVGSLQMSRLKYQSLLHHLQAIVVEIDMNYGTYHMVYNPIPNFQPLPDLFPADRRLEEKDIPGVHPEDVGLTLREFTFLRSDFFRQGLRRHAFACRLASNYGGYDRYRVTFLRLDTGDAGQRKAIIIWQSMGPAEGEDRQVASLQERRAFHILTSNVICRRNNVDFTILSGENNLLDLLGYTGAELRSRFQNRFIELVLPEDRAALRSHINQALSTSSLAESEYRVRHKDGSIRWILEKGCAVLGEDNREYFYGALMDNTRSHEIQDQLAVVMQRNQLIIDQSDDIIFDWDLRRRKVDLSANWQTVFGYDPTIVLRMDELSKSRIHPDDLEVVRGLGKGLWAAKRRQEVEMRIADSQNRYRWFRMRLTPLLDEGGQIYRAVGTLSNIDAIKQSWLALQQQAQRDALTDLLNKASTHEAIQSWLLPGGVEGALLMIDLDNFKYVNDHFGHLFGDTVLTRAAAAIRRLFRADDIIGRVGGDEFMVFMKNTSREELVSERCRQILGALEALFKGQDCPVSCSIGVALAPRHGSGFQELFQRADQALYFAKQNGKHTYAFYQNDLNITLQQFSTPIESSSQPGLAQSGLVRAVFHQLAHSKDMERSIQEVLTLVGQRTNVSRVYIFENNAENTHCSNTFEWCNEGISPEIGNLQDLSYETDLPGWADNYDENGILFCPDVTRLAPGPRAILEPQGVKSMLHRAIYEDGVFRGYIGLDECETYRIWTQEQVDILVFLSEVVASFLLKKRAQDRDNATTANLHNILATQRSWMYVIDPDTYEILYCNDKLQAAMPGVRPGQICYRCLAGGELPCADCVMHKLQGNDHARSHRTFSGQSGRFTTEAVPIRWDGRGAMLITCWQEEK